MASTDESAQKKKGNQKLIIWILAGLLAIMTGLYLNERGESNQLTEDNSGLTLERNNLEEELEDMLEQYDALTVDNDELTAEMIQQKEEITKLMEKVTKLGKDDKNLRWEIDKLKKEAGTLRGIMKSYLVRIDSLNQANQVLTSENLSLNSNLTQVTSAKQQLESTVQSQENIIKTGRVIPAMNIISTGLRVKTTGKQTETNRASRAEMIRTCCTLGENRITPAGAKTLHVRIISPEGVVIQDPNFANATFEFDGISGRYSSMREIQYNNQVQDICVFHTVGEELSTGQYIVELYESGALIGKTSFDLR